MKQSLEDKMREAFKAKSETVLNNIIEKPVKKPVVGLELEFGVFDENANPITREDVNHPKIAKELGRHQIEIITDPMVINSIENFKSNYTKDLGTTLLKLNQKVAGIGSIPNLSLDKFETTPKISGYQKVPKFHNERVNKGYKTLFPELDARHVGLFNALQINIDASSLNDAVSKLNTSLSISPYLVALFSNARFINNKESGFKDARLKVWQETHDIRNQKQRENNEEIRIGLPNTYFTSILDYLSRVSAHDFILEDTDHAFEIGIGLNWHDARIKFIEKENGYLPIVEMRSISSQPNLELDVAATLSYIGMLESQKYLLDIEKVRFNRESALKHGLEGLMFDDTGRIKSTLGIVKEKVEKAKLGLFRFGYSSKSVDEALNPVYRILESGKSPADRYNKNQIKDLVINSFRN